MTEFTTSMGITVFFDRNSTVQFYNKEKDDELVMQLDPSDLKAIYAAYRLMEKEALEEEKISS